MTIPDFPAWRAFGPGASCLLGWEPPCKALPRTALQVLNGSAVRLDRHILRLDAGASELGWDTAWLTEAKSEITAWISTAGTGACRLQLFPDAISAQMEAMPEPFTPYRLLAWPHPLGDIRRDEKAAHKGILGPWDIQARKHAQDQHADDVLLLWPDGTISETAIAAIGLQVNHHLLLPPLEGRVESITEAFELPLWAASRDLIVQQRPIALAEISGGQLWCMNAVRGLWQAEVVQR